MAAKKAEIGLEWHIAASSGGLADLSINTKERFGRHQAFVTRFDAAVGAGRAGLLRSKIDGFCFSDFVIRRGGSHGPQIGEVEIPYGNDKVWASYSGRMQQPWQEGWLW